MARILVIDDSLFMRQVMQSCLPGLGHSVKVAEDGEIGLRLADADSVDIVLLDVEMPRLTGIAVCEELKRDPSRNHLPVLMMTGRLTPEIENSARAAGAAAVLIKPFSLERLQQEFARNLPAGV